MKRRRRSNSVPGHLNDDSSEQSNPSRTVSRRTSVISSTSGNSKKTMGDYFEFCGLFRKQICPGNFKKTLFENGIYA